MVEEYYIIAKELRERLSSVVSIIDFRVFGSRAKGYATEFSDMDVFIEVENINKELEGKINDISWEVGFQNSVHISPLVFTRHEIEDTPLRVSPIVKNIREEGVEI